MNSRGMDVIRRVGRMCKGGGDGGDDGAGEGVGIPKDVWLKEWGKGQHGWVEKNKVYNDAALRMKEAFHQTSTSNLPSKVYIQPLYNSHFQRRRKLKVFL